MPIMDSRKRSLLTPLAALVILAASLAGCLADDDAEVMGTFYPMTFLAEEIGKDAVTVGQIIPDGVEPHEWNPGVRDLTRLSSTQLVVAQGLEFEPWLGPLIDNLDDESPPIVHTGDRLMEHDPDDDHDDFHGDDHDGDHNDTNNDDHDDHNDTNYDDHDDHNDTHDEQDHDETDHDDGHGHDGADPHTWIDPVQFATQARIVRDAMVTAFPGHEETLRSNADALIERLDELHHDFEERIAHADCDTRNIVVQHNAFGHLSKRYDFTVHSVVGLSPQAEPDPPAVARAIDEAMEHNLSVVFTETMANPNVMDAIAQDATEKGTDIEVRVLSPLERRAPAEIEKDLDFIDIMYNNLDELASAMRCTAT